jgi:uncharacterized protein YndB with AHSA1/START domain
MDDRIERDILINAPLDRVWDLVTEPGWWVPAPNTEPPNRTVGTVTVRDSEKWGRFPVEVVRVDPQTYAAFRWASLFPGQDLSASNATLVEFHLAPVDDAVRVTVVESGFAVVDAPEEARAAGVRDNGNGWAEMLADLSRRAERVEVA